MYYGALTPGILNRILESSARKIDKDSKKEVLQVGFGAFEKIGFEPEAIDSIERGLNMELRQRTPLRQAIARKIGTRPSRIKVV